MKILLIEDEAAIRETLQEILELNGYNVLAAADGEAGVQLAEQQPDLILCDIGLPKKDGYQVIQAIHELPHGREIPFIFLSARADRADQRRGMALGADDYITKPFTEKDILEAITARVNRQKPLRERVAQLVNERRVTVDANWSHELMTPLNAVLGGLEMIEEESGSIKPGELRDLLQIIRLGAERQQLLSRKLVFHFEMERRQLLPREGTRARCAVSEAGKAGAWRAAQSENRLSDLRVECEAAEVFLHEEHLITAVAELIGNSLRFSSPGDTVTLTGSRRADTYHLEIVDQGIGLTVEECAQVGPFIQFGRAKREQQGLGLGLANARAVARLAGGTLALRPGSERGLIITLELPCA